MKPRSVFLVSPLVVVLGLAACDSRDYETEVTELSEELSATQAKLDATTSENERLKTELEEMRAQTPSDGAGDGAAGSEGMAPALSEAVQGELEAMTEKLTVALANLSALETQPENGELSKVRENLQEAVGSARTLLTVVSGQQTAPAAGSAGSETPAASDEAPPEVMKEAPADDQEPAQQ